MLLNNVVQAMIQVLKAILLKLLNQVGLGCMWVQARKLAGARIWEDKKTGDIHKNGASNGHFDYNHESGFRAV